MNSNGQKLIVTRPERQAGELIQLIEDELPNTQVSHLPLLSIKPTFTDEKPLKPISNLKKFHGVIFISPNSVQYSKTALSKEDWLKLCNNALFAVGSQTKQCLLKRGVFNQSNASNVESPEQMNTEGLLALPALSNINGQSWLIVKGVGGRQKLEQVLRARGAIVKSLCCYKRDVPNKNQTVDIIEQVKNKALWLITSLQGVTNLKQIIDNFLLDQNISNSEKIMHNCPLIVSSDRIKASALALGFEVKAVSQNASNQQLVNCIRELNS